MKLTRKAFTLAEVLITLAVIGVLAALSLPSLITKINNIQYVTALKKFDSEFTQGMKKMAVDNGCPNDLNCTKFIVSSAQSVLSKIKPYLNITKDCSAFMATGCIYGSNYKTLHGADSGINLDTMGGNILLADGMSVNYQSWGSSCVSTGISGVLSSICAIITVDVNGLKAPNQFGRDVFFFILTNSGDLYPAGGSLAAPLGVGYEKWDDNAGGSACMPENTAFASENGSNCAGRIMEEGWQMNY